MQKQCSTADPIGHAQCTIDHLCYKTNNNEQKESIINVGSWPIHVRKHRDQQVGDQGDFQGKNGKPYMPQPEPFQSVRFDSMVCWRLNTKMSLL